MLTTLELELNTLCDRMEHVCFNCGKPDWGVSALPLFEKVGCNYVQTGVLCSNCQEQMTLKAVEHGT